MVHLPNVRALNRALRDAPWLRYAIYTSLAWKCWLRTMASAADSIQAKTFSLAVTIAGTGEDVYQLSGNDLALRLNTESPRSALPHWIAISSNFVSFGMNADATADWRQLLLCALASESIYLLLGELNTVAELSIVTNARKICSVAEQCICNAN